MSLLTTWGFITRTHDGNMFASNYLFPTLESAKNYEKTLSRDIHEWRRIVPVQIDIFNQFSNSKFPDAWTDKVYIILIYDTRYINSSVGMCPFNSTVAFSTQDRAATYLDEKCRIFEASGWKPVYDKYTCENIKRKYMSPSSKDTIYEGFVCEVKLPTCGITWKE